MLVLMPQTGLADRAKVDMYAKTPEAVKINANLLRLESRMKSESMTLVAAAASVAAKSDEHGIHVEVITTRPGAEVAGYLELPGVTIVHASPTYNRVLVSLNALSLLHGLAQLPEVEMLSPEYGGMSNVGAVTSHAGRALGSEAARTTFMVDGTGQKIGILSDSFAQTTDTRDVDTMPAVGVSGALTGSIPQDSVNNSP
jgi:hypothetical protein